MTSSVNLWALNRGATFQIEDLPDLEFVVVGKDGIYTQVRCLDEEKNKEFCSQYDAGSSFFCLASWVMIIPCVPKAFQVIDTEQADEA
jgi:hypothetical protein